MIHPRYAPVVFALLMAFFMSGIMSLVVTIINIGFTDVLIVSWLNSWPLTFAIAFPVIMVVSPVVKRIVMCLVATEVTAQR